MRLLHTSDWHLGRRLHGVSLLPAQERFLDHLVETVRSERVDAVVVAGDVYDRAVPAPETVALLDAALLKVVDAGAQVILASGNHDSATRLGFGSDLLARAGLHLRTTVSQIGVPIVVDGVAIYALPYLEPSVAGAALGAQERSHAATLRAAMARVHADATVRGVPTVVMAHAFVTGGATSDSERDISVGGVSAVPPEVFDGVDVVALGHLHGPSTVSPNVRYSGSPVAMSFSEAGHIKGSWLWDITGLSGAATVRVEQVAAPVDRKMALLRGDLDDLLRDDALRWAEAAYCQVVVTDPVRPPGALDRLKRRFPHTLRLEFEPTGATTEPPQSYARRLVERGDLDVCVDFLGHVRGGRTATEAERRTLVEALEASRVDRSRADDEGRRVVSARARHGAA